MKRAKAFAAISQAIIELMSEKEQMPLKILRHHLSNISIVLISATLCLLFIEIACRLLDYDFEKNENALDAVPIYYRRPTVPVGEIYFRRPGPATWKGKVVYSGLKNVSKVFWLSVAPEDQPFLEEIARQESEVTVNYDELGFRNPQDLTDWDIAVIGDSFVELGHLPYEDLYTTKIGQLLGIRVKNLGVSHNGPLTYVYYLKEYGRAPRTKHAIMVFCERNDLKNLLLEHQDLQLFRRTGQRRYMRVMKQTSFIKALYHSAGMLNRKEIFPFVAHEGGRTGFLPRRALHNAYFMSEQGEQPISVFDLPPRKEMLTQRTVGLLDKTLSAWSQTARTSGIHPWLVYMPAKRRVLDGHVRFTEDALPETVQWRPTTELPELVKSLCDKHMIRFIDVTPALANEAAAGHLTHNPIFDSHLNRLGSHVVAQVVADELQTFSE